jgi:hypothetical protein
LEDELKNTEPEEVHLTSGLSRQDLRDLNKVFLSQTALEAHIKSIYERLKKHIPKDKKLVAMVWRELKQQFVNKYTWYDRQLRQCYLNEDLSVGLIDLIAMFDKLLAPEEDEVNDENDQGQGQSDSMSFPISSTLQRKPKRVAISAGGDPNSGAMTSSNSNVNTSTSSSTNANKSSTDRPQTSPMQSSTLAQKSVRTQLSCQMYFLFLTSYNFVSIIDLAKSD